MIPKIASLISRALDPIKAVARPGKSVEFTQSTANEGGGHGSLGYEASNLEDSVDPESSDHAKSDSENEKDYEKKLNTVPFQPGLTQVILELSALPHPVSAATSAQHYETSAKEQKADSSPPKGSNLDKKAG